MEWNFGLFSYLFSSLYANTYLSVFSLVMVSFIQGRKIQEDGQHFQAENLEEATLQTKLCYQKNSSLQKPQTEASSLLLHG